jgi:hypothetical protein
VWDYRVSEAILDFNIEAGGAENAAAWPVVARAQQGDLQGIAGRTLLEIEGREMPLLDGPAGIEAAE